MISRIPSRHEILIQQIEDRHREIRLLRAEQDRIVRSLSMCRDELDRYVDELSDSTDTLTSVRDVARDEWAECRVRLLDAVLESAGVTVEDMNRETERGMIAARRYAWCLRHVAGASSVEITELLGVSRPRAIRLVAEWAEHDQISERADIDLAMSVVDWPECMSGATAWISATARVCGVWPTSVVARGDQLGSTTYSSRVIACRAIASHCIVEYMDYSYPDLARVMGLKSHTAMLRQVRRVRGGVYDDVHGTLDEIVPAVRRAFAENI